MKLTNLIFLDGTPKLPGFRALGQGPYTDWTVHVRPQAVFLVSPPGWQVNTSTRKGTVQVVHEIPRNRVLVSWEREQGEDLAKTGVWSPPACWMCKAPVAEDGHKCDACRAATHVPTDSPSPQDADVDPATRAAEGPSDPPPVMTEAVPKRGPGRPRKTNE